MGFFRRIVSLLGIAPEDEADGEGSGGSSSASSDAGVEGDEQSEAEGPRSGLSAKGFGVQVPERPSQGPVVVPCDFGDQGGVQGFKWYTRSLRIDDDGDVADEFLDEVEVPTTAASAAAAEQTMVLPKFQVKYKTRPSAAAMRKHVFAANGNILHSFQHHGRMMLA